MLRSRRMPPGPRGPPGVRDARAARPAPGEPTRLGGEPRLLGLRIPSGSPGRRRSWSARPRLSLEILVTSGRIGAEPVAEQHGVPAIRCIPNPQVEVDTDARDRRWRAVACPTPQDPPTPALRIGCGVVQVGAGQRAGSRPAPSGSANSSAVARSGTDELQVDDVLGGQSRDRGRSDVVDRQATGRRRNPGRQQRRQPGQSRVGLEQHGRPGADARRPPPGSPRTEAGAPTTGPSVRSAAGRRRAVVVQPHVGQRRALVVGDLRPDPGPGIGLGQPASTSRCDPWSPPPRRPRPPGGKPRGHRERPQQRNVVDHDRVGRGGALAAGRTRPGPAGG